MLVGGKKDSTKAGGGCIEDKGEMGTIWRRQGVCFKKRNARRGEMLEEEECFKKKT